MFSVKRTIILLIIFFISHYNGICQQATEISINPTHKDRVISGHDSIYKKPNGAFLAGKEDAKEYYNDNKAFTISFFTSFLVPPVGLITTIVISLKKPEIEILDVPNIQLLKNEDYAKGYIHKAKRIKVAKAWGGCAAGLAFFGIGFFMLYGINY